MFIVCAMTSAYASRNYTVSLRLTLLNLKYLNCSSKPKPKTIVWWKMSRSKLSRFHLSIRLQEWIPLKPCQFSLTLSLQLKYFREYHSTDTYYKLAHFDSLHSFFSSPLSVCVNIFITVWHKVDVFLFLFVCVIDKAFHFVHLFLLKGALY